jgi:hypothetical protein
VVCTGSGGEGRQKARGTRQKARGIRDEAEGTRHKARACLATVGKPAGGWARVTGYEGEWKVTSDG